MEPQDPDITTEFSGFEDVVDLIGSLAETPDPDVRAAHIQSASQAAGDAVVVPLAADRGWMGTVRTEVLGRAAAVVMAVVLGISGLAAAGALPASAQDAVNVVAGYFGFQFPSVASEDDSGSEDPAAVVDVSTTVVESTTTEADEDEQVVGVIDPVECHDDDESESVTEEPGEVDDEGDHDSDGTDLDATDDCTDDESSTTTSSTTVTTPPTDDDDSSEDDEEGDDHADDDETDEEKDS